MKLIKCGKHNGYDYCITQQKSKRGGIFNKSCFELFLDVSHDNIMKAWLIKHANDDDIKCLGISHGVVSVGMNGKPKTKFKDHMFARFKLQAYKIQDVMEYANNILCRIYEFKILARIEGIEF